MTGTPDRPSIRIIPQSPQQEAHNREMARRQELRTNALVPLYFFHTPDVMPIEAHAAFLGTQDALAASGQKRSLVNLGSQAYGAGEYSSPFWYIEEAMKRQGLRRDAGYGPQLDVGEVIRLFPLEPWQQIPHWEVFVVNQDLSDRGRDGRYLNFVFGSTNALFPASVESIKRLCTEVPTGPLREAMVRRLLRHEVGHMFGLPGPNRGKTEEKLGRHCTNVCTMRQGMSVEEWAKLTREEAQQKVHFCADCMRDLAKVRNRFRPI